MDSKKFPGVLIPKSLIYLFIIFLLVCVIAILNIKVAVGGFTLFLGVAYYSHRTNRIRREEVTKYIENLTFNIDTATKDTLLNFPMPLVVLELDGTIIWYNSSFREIFDGEDLLQRTMSFLVKDLDPLNFSSESSPGEITINDRNYNVLQNLVKINNKRNEDSFILLLYLIDNTELVQIREKYQNEKSVVGIIVIDNYDDLMQSTEDTKRAQLIAEIDQRITQNMSFMQGIIKKFERDKYLCVFEYGYLKDLNDKKYDILDIVKEINVGNKIPVTLSVGIGMNGDALIQNFLFASASIDLALGRGGDQVVIKNGENINFFGGKTKEFEKRTKVKARVISFALRELIDQSPSVMIMGHENTDIDSLGAALGLYRIAKERGKDSYIVLNFVNPTISNLMDKIEKSKEYDGVFIGKGEALNRINKKTLLIVVDTYRPSFTDCPELLECTSRIVVIDHHRRGAENIQDAVLTYQETYASSTCELVTEILQYVEQGIKLSPLEAEALYAGMVVDTKNFAFKTGVRTFEAAAYLRRQGVDTVSVKQILQNDLTSYIAVSNVVQNAEILYDGIAVSHCPKDTKASQLIAAQAADQLISLSGITAAFVLSYVEHEIYISGRSLGDINVHSILEKLGGGGHFTVAGAQLQNTTMQEAIDRLKSTIMEYVSDDNIKDT